MAADEPLSRLVTMLWRPHFRQALAELTHAHRENPDFVLALYRLLVPSEFPCNLGYERVQKLLSMLEGRNTRANHMKRTCNITTPAIHIEPSVTEFCAKLDAACRIKAV